MSKLKLKMSQTYPSTKRQREGLWTIVDDRKPSSALGKTYPNASFSWENCIPSSLMEDGVDLLAW